MTSASSTTTKRPTPKPGTQEQACSDRSSEAIDRGYGDEHGGYLIEPTEQNPRKPAAVPETGVTSDKEKQRRDEGRDVAQKRR